MKKIKSTYTNPYCDFYSQLNYSIINKKTSFVIVYEQVRLNIVKSFYKEGIISKYSLIIKDNKSFLKIELKMFKGTYTINNVKLISRPSRLVSVSLKEIILKKNYESFFLLTSKGFLFDKEAIKENQGGFLLYSLN